MFFTPENGVPNPPGRNRKKGEHTLEFRPCIDIHNGQVKQIVGGALVDEGDQAQENFVSLRSGAYYASLYRDLGLKGGHVILLNPKTSPYYPADLEQARSALSAFPGGLQLGGGVTPENAPRFLDWGASHVIVTSYVFSDGEVNWDRLRRLEQVCGKRRLVLDVSCRKREGEYYIVTDRWQKFTRVPLTSALLDRLSRYCDEFLVHGVDVEGKQSGVELGLIKLLSCWGKIPCTYAGGIHSLEDIRQIKRLGDDRIHITIGSALDLFGGPLKQNQVLECCRTPL